MSDFDDVFSQIWLIMLIMLILFAKSALLVRVSLVFHFKTPGKSKFRNQIAFLVFTFRKHG